MAEHKRKKPGGRAEWIILPIEDQCQWCGEWMEEGEEQVLCFDPIAGYHPNCYEQEKNDG
jgi:hypothetical protein